MSTIHRPALPIVRRVLATLVVLCVLHLGLWPSADRAFAQGPNFLNGFTGDPGGPTATTLPR